MQVILNMLYMSMRKVSQDITPELIYDLAAKGTFRTALPKALGVSRTTLWQIFKDRPELEQAYLDGELAALEAMESHLAQEFYSKDVGIRDKIALYSALSRYKVSYRIRLEKTRQATAVDYEAVLEDATDEELKAIVENPGLLKKRFEGISI